jgi:calcium channel MID1
MQLSLLQSRLAATLVASCLLLALYLTLFTPHFALAAELQDERAPILEHSGDHPDLELRGPLDPTYEPEFTLFDRSIIGRAPAGVTALTNNVPASMNVVVGTTQNFMYTISSVSSREAADEGGSRGLELRSEHTESMDQSARIADRAVDSSNHEEGVIEKRQSTKTIYISANTCQQPEWTNGTAPKAPQLTLYVSKSATNQSPGPGQAANTQDSLTFTGGAVMYSLNTTSDVYIGITASNITGNFSKPYNVEVAISVDMWYHSYNAEADADLIWVDSDSQGSLLMTHNLTKSTDNSTIRAIMNSLPYVMFAQNQIDEVAIDGLHFSYCGLKNYANIAATKNGKFTNMVTTGMTTRGQGSLPKQQFYFSGLNASSSYLGILAQDGNTTITSNGTVSKRESSAPGGGGHVSKATRFTTKSGKYMPPPIQSLHPC